jgi:hypothetical protein
MPTLIGVDTSNTIPTAAFGTSGKAFGLGDRHVDQAGNEWVFVRAGTGGITGTGYVVRITSAYVADMLSTANDARGTLVGVAPVAFAANDYGWVQVKGTCPVRVAASCLADVRLNTTAVAGQIDDDGTAGAIEVVGITLTVANGGVAGNAPAVLNYPIQGVTL